MKNAYESVVAYNRNNIGNVENHRLKLFTQLLYIPIIAGMIVMTACSPVDPQIGNNAWQASTPAAITKTPFQPAQTSLYLSPGIPEKWRTAIETISEVSTTIDEEGTQFTFDQRNIPEGQEPIFSSKIIMAAVVPFMTVDDEISMDEIKKLWNGVSGDGQYQTLIVTEETRKILEETWGENGSSVEVVNDGGIVSLLEESKNSIGILPFEAITPRCKVLKIDGSSPLDKPFDEVNYPLIANYHLIAQSADNAFIDSIVGSFAELIPATNRDESKMTVVVMSGTTAMARCTASKILLKGTDYPIEEIKEWFLTADLRHVSNEVAFSEDCPRSNTCSVTLQLCSHPEAIEVLEKLGVNIVELTGNHENDYGTESFAKTLEMYAERGWYIFGGGINDEEAKKPVLIESNGNKIAFIGCNPVGFGTAWATEDSPGAAKCDYEYMYGEIQDLKSQGYVVITTFQHNEVYVYMYSETYREDFKNAAAAGADIVQGSQAHFPMGFEFIGNSLIHYGLGNLLFDQMDIPVVGTKREFVDRHIIYDGKYINTEVLTAMLTDWSRPVPMELTEREQLLSDIFEASQKEFP